MRVLVTGGTGFVGRRLVEHLLARGDEVIVLSRDPSRSTRDLRATRVAAWDPMAGPPPPEMLSVSDAVVNLLGESIARGRWTPAKKKRIRESRVVGTRHLVDGILAASPRPGVLVSGSAIGYYGARGDEELDERSSPGSGFLADVSRAWEAEAERAAASGLRVTRLRTGIVLGPKGGALGAMLPPFKFGLGGPLGSGEQWMSWIHRDDLTGLIAHAIDHSEVSGPVNGTAPDPVRNRAFTKTLGAVLNRPAFLPAPAFALRIALGEMADEMLLTGQKVLPKRARETGFRFKHPVLEGALREILHRSG